MAGRRTAGGLVCSHGSDLDMRIPRAKVPSSALPPEVRAAMGLKPRKERKRSKGAAPYKAGAGVLVPRSSQDGNYAAGCQKNFLRRGSGKAMSSRASRKAQLGVKDRRRTYSKPTQAVQETGYGEKHARRKNMKQKRQNVRCQSQQATNRRHNGEHANVRRDQHRLDSRFDRPSQIVRGI